MPPFALNLLSLLAIAIAYGPLLAEFGSQLWAKPYYQHFPFVLLASGLLFAQQLATSEAKDAPHYRSLAIVAYFMAWLVLLAAYQASYPLVAAASFVLLAGGWALSLSHRLGRSFPIGPWLLLCLLIPIPRFEGRMIRNLQGISSNLSSQALDLFGVRHLMEGNTLVLPDKQLFVDEACSGIISAISIVACAAIYGVWRRRSALHTILLMAAAISWAMLLNVVRITSIALAHFHLKADWSEGFSHTLLGLVVFTLSLVCLVATDWFLRAALAEVGPRWAVLTGEPLLFGKPLVRVWDRIAQSVSQKTFAASAIDWHRLAWTTGALSIGAVPIVAFGGLGATQLVRPAWVEPAPFPDTSGFAANLQKEVMPEHLLGLTLMNVTHKERSSSSVFGKHSVVFKYVGENGNDYLISCDFPFQHWHELSVCYRGIGWEVERTVGTINEAASPDGESSFGFAQLELSKPEGQVALVTFCACYENGERVDTPPTFGAVQELLRIFSRRDRGNRDRLTFQVQIMASRTGSLSGEDRRMSRKLLDEARRRFIAVSLATP